jgi:hypothetical protein
VAAHPLRGMEQCHALKTSMSIPAKMRMSDKKI